MTDMRGMVGQKTIFSPGSEGSWMALRLSRDGAAITMPWFQSLVLGGVCFQASHGVEATTLTLATAYADTAKTIFVDIPDGTAFIPLEVNHSVFASGAVGRQEIGFITDVVNGTGGTETAITPLNLRRDGNAGSSVGTAAHTASGEADSVSGVEIKLYHRIINQDADGVGIEPFFYWSAAKAGITPVGMDAGSFSVITFNPTSGTGSACITWAELNESYFQ